MLACRTGTLNNLLFKEQTTHTHTARIDNNKKKRGKEGRKLHKEITRKKERKGNIYKCQINSIKANLTLKKATATNNTKQAETHTHAFDGRKWGKISKTKENKRCIREKKKPQ